MFDVNVPTQRQVDWVSVANQETGSYVVPPTMFDVKVTDVGPVPDCG
jgi:hypothetical protein